MTGKIFVHIGLPKTATTTLQKEIFPALSNGVIQYLGVFQPRQENRQSDLYSRFCNAVYSGSSTKEVRSTLASMLNTGTTIILSEEMFTVSSSDVHWRIKLKNLAGILQGLDYTLILTVREPTSALFSYYVELHDKFSREKKDFLELARNDERMHVFHYQKLTEEIFQNFDPQRVFVQKFEDIVAGRLEELCRLITSGHQGWLGHPPQRHNDKKKAGNIVYTGKKFTLADIPRRLFISLGIMDTSFAQRLKKAFAPVLRALDSVDLLNKKVVRPSEAEMRQLTIHLRDETAALEKRFGIKYE
jgi:hypothetical protein